MQPEENPEVDSLERILLQAIPMKTRRSGKSYAVITWNKCKYRYLMCA
jgi:hypothetical protein